MHPGFYNWICERVAFSYSDACWTFESVLFFGCFWITPSLSEWPNVFPLIIRTLEIMNEKCSTLLVAWVHPCRNMCLSFPRDLLQICCDVLCVCVCMEIINNYLHCFFLTFSGDDSRRQAAILQSVDRDDKHQQQKRFIYIIINQNENIFSTKSRGPTFLFIYIAYFA